MIHNLFRFEFGCEPLEMDLLQFLIMESFVSSSWFIIAIFFFVFSLSLHFTQRSDYSLSSLIVPLTYHLSFTHRLSCELYSTPHTALFECSSNVSPASEKRAVLYEITLHRRLNACPDLRSVFSLQRITQRCVAPRSATKAISVGMNHRKQERMYFTPHARPHARPAGPW